MGRAGWEGVTNLNTTGSGKRAGRGYVAQEHVAGVETKRVAYLGLDSSREAGEDITREEELACARAGTVTILDVRTDEEYSAAPRGAYCVLGYEAVDLLHVAGRPARPPHEGMLEWRLGGPAVEAAAA